MTRNVPPTAARRLPSSKSAVAESTVYAMARSIADNLDKLPQMNPLFKGLKSLFDPLRAKGAAAFEFGGVPLHPGANRAYKETGWLK